MIRRLLFSYLGLAVLILLILEVPLATLAQRFERQLATNQIEKQANALVAVASDDLGPARRSQLQAVVASYRARTGGEVTILSPERAVLATSSEDADNDMQEWREVIDRALTGQSSAIYTSDEGGAFGVAAAPVYDEGRLLAVVMLGAPATFTQHRIHDIWLALGIFAIGAILVATAVGIVLARSMALPLGRLEATVHRFGRGELSTRASESQGPAEVRSLATQFNHMADQLDDLIETQKRFVADASHQLRSPLTALRLRLENLEATGADDSQDAIAAAGREVQRLSRIVDGLLTLSRSGDNPEATVDVDVFGVIEERCDAWSALAAERGVSLDADRGRRSRVLRRLYPGDLDQIIDNLLANAVEVSPDDSRIRVLVNGAGQGSVEVHVLDEGSGLSPEERKRAFDRFWQGSNHSGHSGLGLAIVRRLAERNGLDVELRAADPSGLDAVVVLPPQPEHPVR